MALTAGPSTRSGSPQLHLTALFTILSLSPHLSAYPPFATSELRFEIGFVEDSSEESEGSSVQLRLCPTNIDFDDCILLAIVTSGGTFRFRFPRLQW